MELKKTARFIAARIAPPQWTLSRCVTGPDDPDTLLQSPFDDYRDEELRSARRLLA